MLIKRSAIIICGDNRALAEIDGESFLEITIEKLENFKEIIICTNNKDIEQKYKKVTKVIFHENINKAFLLALSIMEEDYALVISSNMILLKEEYLEYLGRYEFSEDVLLTYTFGKFNNLLGIYSKRFLKKSNGEFCNNNYKGSVRYIFPKDEEYFLNVNGMWDYINVCAYNQKNSCL